MAFKANFNITGIDAGVEYLGIQYGFRSMDIDQKEANKLRQDREKACNIDEHQVLYDHFARINRITTKDEEFEMYKKKTHEEFVELCLNQKILFTDLIEKAQEKLSQQYTDYSKNYTECFLAGQKASKEMNEAISKDYRIITNNFNKEYNKMQTDFRKLSAEFSNNDFKFRSEFTSKLNKDEQTLLEKERKEHKINLDKCFKTYDKPISDLEHKIVKRMSDITKSINDENIIRINSEPKLNKLKEIVVDNTIINLQSYTL